jgi:hypothetical protein
MNTFATSIMKLLAASLLAAGVTASFARTPAPNPPPSVPTAAVSVPDAMVQPVKRKKGRKVRTTVTRTRVHKRTVARHTHTHSQAESTAAGATSTSR